MKQRGQVWTIDRLEGFVKSPDLTPLFFLLKITTPAGAALTSTSFILDKVSLCSTPMQDSTTIDVMNTTLNTASLSTALAAGSYTGVVGSSFALGYSIGTLANRTLIKNYWGNKVYDWLH